MGSEVSGMGRLLDEDAYDLPTVSQHRNRLLAEVDRLRDREQKLVAAIEAAVFGADMNPTARAELRKAIEENDDGK